MDSFKFILTNIPKFLQWLLGILIAPVMSYFIIQMITKQHYNLSHSNIVIYILIVFALIIFAFFIGAIRSISKLREEKNTYFDSANNINKEKKLITLPYTNVKIGEYVTVNFAVDIRAIIILEENTKPDISLFLKRISIDIPYCPQCSRQLDYWKTTWMANGAQIGYQCLNCDTQRKGDINSVLNEVKAEVRKDFEKFWKFYKNKILELTNGEPEKYRLP